MSSTYRLSVYFRGRSPTLSVTSVCGIRNLLVGKMVHRFMRMAAMIWCGWRYLSDRILSCSDFIHSSSSSSNISSSAAYRRILLRLFRYFWLLSLHLFYLRRPWSTRMKQAAASERPAAVEKAPAAGDCYRRRGAVSNNVPRWSGTRRSLPELRVGDCTRHGVSSSFIKLYPIATERGSARTAIFRIHKPWAWWDGRTGSAVEDAKAAAAAAGAE